MSAYVICVTSGGGLPIFVRRKGNVESLPFSVIGSLNGTHMFGKSLNVDLRTVETDDYVASWREFSESLVLIGISSGCTVDVLNKLLESVFNAIVLIVGSEEIKTQRNIERLKRELRICYPVIDRLLDSLDCGDAHSKNSSDLIGLAECIMCSENHLMQIVLDSFTECVDSVFSCILIHGKIAAATESWWTLNPVEINLLSLLATSEDTTNSKDIPVFLPFKSPNVAFRFVTCTLIPDVQLACLCGPTPTLNEIEHSATNCFKNSTDILNTAVQCHPRNFPSSCHVDGGILGLLLINSNTGKYMISKNPQSNASKKPANNSHRLDILRTFFYQSVMKFLMHVTTEEQDDDKGKNDDSNMVSGTETYWCSEYHKCHAIKMNENILCVLYSSSVPTHAMKLISQNTLKQILTDKQICW